MTYQGYGMTIPFMGVPLHEQGDWIRELAEKRGHPVGDAVVHA